LDDDEGGWNGYITLVKSQSVYGSNAQLTIPVCDFVLQCIICGNFWATNLKAIAKLLTKLDNIENRWG
jgi:hypothetical protein